ncbi:DUF262 domain-containing HNH endonuclease family protein [Microbacterium capsulatum]|uniref:DUF262 domain-containing HNH endonuclease family protein n=1 Tax=Microbacterium capsulatum TaxID=3041921 RepID=A0ABU0XN28_9MICO|nr:DUF262 domain-containing HNH endonuclease family protein [Microbacterium sp. ASV81]MDQ4215490.1 DUF262 domain-containing HNH endonuclease family protein [Microbacterium sp. ASV81]
MSAQSARLALVDVKEYSLGRVLEGRNRYLIPLYQRRYSWENVHYEQLWDDVVDTARRRRTAPNHGHFTGSLVLAAGLPDPGGMTTFTVVDGQQRLTTLSVLLLALRDHWDSIDDPQRRAEVHETYLTNRFQSGDAQWKLLPTQADRQLYLGMLGGVHRDDPDSRLDDAYRFFARALGRLDGGDPDASEIQQAVLNGLHFVTITTQDDDNVYRIFESLNNTGLPLTQADLIRNLVFMRLGDRGEAVYDSIWQPLQDGLSPDDLVNLFWYDLLWQDPTTRRADTFDAQKARIVGMDATRVEEFLRRIERAARSLRVVRNPSAEPDPVVRRLLRRSARWGAAGAEALIVRILDEGQRKTFTPSQVADALDALEGYLVRRFLVGATASGLGDILNDAAHRIVDEPDPAVFLLRFLSTGRRRFASDEQVRTAIATRNFYWVGRAAQRRTILEWILELHGRKESAIFDGTTIEHVLPQTLTDVWREEFGASLEPGEDLDLVYEGLVHTLGNLTLTGYNSELSNRPFAEKRLELSNSSIPDNQEIARKATWGAAQIRERADHLANRVIDRWRGPVVIDDDPTDVERRWALLAELTAAIPPGYWTTYYEAATVIGSHAVAVGQRLAKAAPEGAWRVLRWTGEASSGFVWPSGSSHAGAPVIEVLQLEGLSFDKEGRADPSRRLAPDRLRALIGLPVEEDSGDERGESQADGGPEPGPDGAAEGRGVAEDQPGSGSRWSLEPGVVDRVREGLAAERVVSARIDGDEEQAAIAP